MTKIIFNKKFFLAVLISICFIGLSKAQINDPSRYAAQSVLSSGKWVKIKVEETGFYKITYEKLREWGISNPQKARIYGYGGWVLNQDFTDPYLRNQDDLPPVSVWMNKSPESFGPGDYMIFYGKGSVKWTYKSGLFEHIQNSYSGDSYYFVTESDEGPKLINERASAAVGTDAIDTYDDYYLHEKDLVNITQTGREFYGESFRSKTSHDFSVPLPGITPDKATIAVSFITRTSGRSKLFLTVNNNLLFEKICPAISPSSDNDYYKKAKELNASTLANLSDNNIINLRYERASTSDENIHLNYFTINFKRQLKPYSAVTLFRSKTISPNLSFRIKEATSNLMVFDVTEGETPEKITGNFSGSEFSFAAANTSIREYAMVDATKKMPEPSYVGQVANQNLHGMNSAEMVIIVRPALISRAQELAELHYNDSGLESVVVTAEDIYNEFSSGKPDVTAYRRFLKMFYDRAQNEDEKPKYLLLLGDGSYDNRFINSNWKEADKRAMLLTYQSKESINELESYTTDDYIGFLNDTTGLDEGDKLPGSVDIVSSKLDIGIGRLTVRNDAEAAAVINKIRTYLLDEDKGLWKNNVAFVADDQNKGSKFEPGTEGAHVGYSDSYATTLNDSYPSFITNKIYMDAHEMIIQPSGARYPSVTEMLKNKFDSGLLFLNYVGHGSTIGWAHENIIDFQFINNLTNKHLPLLITATCDFGRYDADETSAGELFFLNAKGGAIALFTTSRVVYGTSNDKLNKNLINHIFEKQNGTPARLGDILRDSKISITDVGAKRNGLRFSLVGDPALRLSYPDDTYKVEITDVNGISSSSTDIQIKALANNVIKGRIADNSDGTFSDFQGTLDVVIYDSELDLKTRGNARDGSNPSGTMGIFDYKDYTNLLYTGSVKIVNGEFSIEFVTPKDILYTNNSGKMSFYAYTDDYKYQAQGAFLNYKVGGVDDNGTPDTTPPVISQMYMNRADFVSGGKVNTTPIFYAKVSDDTGINVSNGIGHNMSITVDGTKTYDLRSSFTSTSSDGSLKEGEIRYVLPELSEGKHHLMFRVWDLWNNPQTATLEFEVVRDYKPVVYNLKIKSNPAKEKAVFYFESDVDGLNVDVKYEVYSITGQLVWSEEVFNTTDNEVTWYLESGGAPVSAGVYVCRMTVSMNGGVKATKSEKLIILGQ